MIASFPLEHNSDTGPTKSASFERPNALPAADLTLPKGDGTLVQVERDSSVGVTCLLP